LRRIAFDELLSSAREIRRLRALLSRGGLVALPTETYYGLAVDPLHHAGVRRVFEAKGRPAARALPVLLATRAQLEGLGVHAPEPVLERFLKIWPAPLTVVFPISRPIPASAGERSLAVRIPASERLRHLLGAVGAVTGTSANRSGALPLDEADAVAAHFGQELDWLIDGGKTPGGPPSTIVDATVDPPAVLRPGAYPWLPSVGRQT
jgi:L-threonylcarbamoyladenylate synthase